MLLRVLFALLVATPALAQPGGPAGPPAVGVAKAQKRPIVETSEFVGRIQSVNRVDLVARVTAFIQERRFTEGGEVRTGDLLYRLERPPFEAQVAAQAALVAQYNAVLQGSSLTLGRAEALLNTPAGQRSRVDDALSTQRSQAAQLSGAQAQLRLAQNNLDYTEIKAPIDGKISRTSVTEGNVVGPSSGTLATIVSQDPMYVLFPVSVRAALDLRDRYAEKGGFGAVSIKLKLPNGREYDQAGTLDYVDNTVATNTDTLTFRGRVPNPVRGGLKPGEPGDRELSDGQFVTVTLEGVQPIEQLAIPRAAVLSDQQGSYVWVIGEGNKAEQRRIMLGQSTPAQAVISEGLKDGETVVVDGLQRVRPGVVVNPGPVGGGPAMPPQAPRT
ncbi:MAG: efflux RND transporter periplasmic adaptor subunit [Gemmatimonadaceae bacterium]|nr:efflux RND transporter periplasmic adaptor subunit [Acetobacteraceae bacterium]